jgi:hypothetical protein
MRAFVHVDQDGRIANVVVQDPTAGAPTGRIVPQPGHEVLEVELTDEQALLSPVELRGAHLVDRAADEPRLIRRETTS